MSFTVNPLGGDTYTYNGVEYTYNGIAWTYNSPGGAELAYSGPFGNEPAEILEGGGAGGFITPVITPANPAAVNEGQTWSGAQACDTVNVNWLISDYTGTGSSYIGFDDGVVGGVEEVPGTYTANIRAGNIFGISDAQLITIVINSFTLTGDTLFGTYDELRLFDNAASGNVYYAFHGVVRYVEGSYYMTHDNAVWATAMDHLMFWSPAAAELISFRVGSGGTVDGIKKWTGVSSHTEGMLMSSAGTGGFDTGTVLTDCLARTVRGKKMPTGPYTWLASGGHALEIVPTAADGWADSFGCKGQAFSYGFTLDDDWVAGTGCAQMLTPATAADGWHLFGLAGYGIGTSPYEYVSGGNSTSGPFASSTGLLYNINTRDWKIGSAGDHVTVTYNGVSTYKVYVEDFLMYSGTTPSVYMKIGTTTDPRLSFGSIQLANGGSTPGDEQDPSGWISRLSDLWIANGTEYALADVQEIMVHKDGAMAASDNYAAMDFYLTMDPSGYTIVKGAATISRSSTTFN
jgi:hypothetical protein